MFARSIPIRINGEDVGISTPLVVPSFSSKAFPDSLLNILLTDMSRFITDSFLISAYDLHHGSITNPNHAFAELMFLDSGGYELRKDPGALEPRYPERSGFKPYEKHDYKSVLASLKPTIPTIAVSFDNPVDPKPIREQIKEAHDLFENVPNVGRELLLKPESSSEPFVDLSSILMALPEMDEFDCLGVVEEELGDSVYERMQLIARFRSGMEKQGIQKPIHIFGSLDPVVSPMYFMAGADIFDGLDWIRFSFLDDVPVHHKSRIALQYGVHTEDTHGEAMGYADNIIFLSTLANRMNQYLKDEDVSVFGRYHESIRAAWNDFSAKPEGGG